MEQEEAVGAGYLLEQVTQKDLGKRLQVGQEVTELILDGERSPELEQDQSMLDRIVDAVASSWVNSSNFKVKSAAALTQMKNNKLSCFRAGRVNTVVLCYNGIIAINKMYWNV